MGHSSGQASLIGIARQMMEAILQKWDSLTQTETGIDASIRGALIPQVLTGGRRGFALRAGRPDAPRLWTIEPQVQIDARFRGLPCKQVDFLLTPVGRSSGLPIVIEMDGIEYHAGTVAQDLLDRMLMIRSGQVRVESRSGWDVDGVEIRVILDFGAGFIDRRGWFMNAGA